MPLPALNEPLLEAQHIVKCYPKSHRNKKPITVLNDVSLKLYKSQTLGIIGESGCGKSTLAKILMQIEKETAGQLLFQSTPFTQIKKAEFWQRIQMVFQNCYSSLNPRKKALSIVAEPLIVNSTLSKKECLVQAQEVLSQVGLTREYWHRYPHMFSGGQRQRIGIARAIITKPQIVICDEPVSALDISIQAQVINLMMALQKEYTLSYIIISHDLAVVNHISDQIMVMYFGKIAEYGATKDIFTTPKHPYTRALLDSTARITDTEKKKTTALSGDIPSPYDPPSGCAFHTRCPIAKRICREETPPVRKIDNTMVACHFAEKH